MMKRKRSSRVLVAASLFLSMGVLACARVEDGLLSREFEAELAEIELQDVFEMAEVRTSAELSVPVRLEADGKPIDIGELSAFAHAGPWIADVDGDGDRDLLVGDFPGHFWLFENEGGEAEPLYTSRGKLQAGGEDAKTPVY